MDNKSSRELSKEQQIQVIRRAITKYEEQYIENGNENGYIFHGLCYYLKKSLLKLYNIQSTRIEGFELKDYIPIFNYKNAVKYGQAYGKYNFYWWSGSDHKSRLKFMNWMLEELRKQ